jgi:hypothetical protein
MGVGIAAIPGGVIYGLLVAAGFARWWNALLSVTLGLWLGRTIWKRADARLFQPALVANRAVEILVVDPSGQFGSIVLSAAEFTALSELLQARENALILACTVPVDDRREAETQISEEFYAGAHS